MKKKMVSGLMMVMLLVAGCASFTNWWNNNKSNLQLAVDIAVAATVDSNPASAPAIGKVATEVINVVNASQQITLDQLSSYVLSEINLPNLSAPDKKVLADLMANLTTSLQGYFLKQNITDPAQQLVIIKDMAQMVLDALGTPAMQAHIRKARATHKGGVK